MKEKKDTPLSPDAVRELFRQIGSKGGKSKAASMTKAERSANARKMVQARWEKYRAEKRKQAERRG